MAHSGHPSCRRECPLLGVKGTSLIHSSVDGSTDIAPWHQSFEDAVMVLSGQGPVRHAKEPWGRFFAGFYALVSGTVFIVAIGIILAPIVHRILHHIHVPDDS